MMEQEKNTIQKIQLKFKSAGEPALIPLHKGTFKASLKQDGISFEKTGFPSFLKWEVYTETVNFLIKNNGKALFGNATENSKLGDDSVPLSSVEGHIAHNIFNVSNGESVVRLKSPIRRLLEWAEICKSEEGYLILL